MSEVYLGHFRTFVIEQLRDIEAIEAENYSTRWFLMRYLRRIIQLSNPPSRKGQVENAIRALMRFYIDNLDENSELGERCQKVYDEYRKTLRFQ